MFPLVVFAAAVVLGRYGERRGGVTRIIAPGLAGAGRAPWDLAGEDIGVVYHGGSRKVRRVDPALLQTRDTGFYGEGFYVTTSPEHARTYGPVISAFRFAPGTRILNSTLTPEEASPAFVALVKRALYDDALPMVKMRGKSEADLHAEIAFITNNPISWKNAVTQFAKLRAYPVVRHSSGEIVVRDVSVLHVEG